jgi:hypothetical protein
MPGTSSSLLAGALLAFASFTRGAQADELRLSIRLPDFEEKGDDAYLCTAVRVPQNARNVIRIEPEATADVVHHMLLFGASPTDSRLAPGYLHALAIRTYPRD